MTATSKPWYRRRWALALIVPGLFVVGLLALVLLVYMVRVPLPEDIEPVASIVFDVHGEEVGSLTAETTRADVHLDALPEHVSLAVLAAEDRGFYRHGGVSPLGIVRAVYVNVREGEISQGGSTITQQYIKNAVVGTERTLWRKVREAALAIKVERKYDKRTILEWYLNTIYWGRGAQGIGAAAQTYFDTTAEQLDLNQAATLAGIIQAPERLDPADGGDAVDARRRYVLDGMLEEGWITEAEHGEAVAAGAPSVSDRPARSTQTAPYFVDAVRRELHDALGDSAVARGLRVHTALDPALQAEAERVVSDGLADTELDAGLSGAVVSVEPDTGAVRALVGGSDFSEQPFNAAVQAVRQTGSTFKAFTLASFMEAGNSPESVLPAPAVIAVPDKEDGIHDYANQDRGHITVREATAVSANTVFVQMQQEVGAEAVAAVASRLGLPTQRQGESAFSMGSSMTLGVDGFTPLEVAEAYNTLNARGVHVEPHLITRVEDAAGNVIWEPEGDRDAVLDENVALATTDVMRAVVESGTGRAADIGRPAAGKTGTTQGGADGWFAGYTPQLTTVVWVGRVGSNEPVEGLTGGGLPAQLWQQVMTAAMADLEPLDFPAASLADLQRLNDPNEGCPDGWHRAQGPVEGPPPDGGPAPTAERTEVLPGTEDDDPGPCVRTVVVTPSLSPTPTATGSPTPTPSPTPTVSPTEEPTSEPSPTPTATTPSPSPTSTPTPTTSPTPSPTPTQSPSPQETATSADESPSPEPTTEQTDGSTTQPVAG